MAPGNKGKGRKRAGGSVAGETGTLKTEQPAASLEVHAGLDTPVRVLKGVGPKIEKALKKRGIASVEDLFCFIPARYEDRRLVRSISGIMEGEQNVVMGRVVDSGAAYSRSTRRRLCHARIEDGTGTLTLKWFRFNKRWMADVCATGNLLLISGKPSRYGVDLQIVHPKVVVLREGETEDVRLIVPVYPEIEGVTQGALRNVIEEAFDGFRSDLVSLIPERIRTTHGVPPLSEAFMRCHFPGDEPPDDASRQHDLARIILEEFFLFQLALLIRRREMRRSSGIAMKAGSVYNRVITSLPFTLTGGQVRVLADIERDMALAEPMNRLLQGDVGSGKTICAILATSIAVDNGFQVAFMAPTEILAEQHFLSIHSLLDEAGVPHTLLTGGSTGTGRTTALERIREGSISVIVGTHAILQSDVVFNRLGLIVIDEQHRFGVMQRSTLRQKAAQPHILVMSATPIPRSLSMVVYGDLDLSVIDDKPGKGQRVDTRVITDQEWRVVHEAIVEEVEKGRQAFLVYPILEESEATVLRSAQEGFIRLQRLFPSLRVGLLHGKMKTEEKRAVMVGFRDCLLDILVCTTVVEVGIDVPNASLIVVAHAERFGLSQLHQLRGRVCRGAYPSRCILMSAETRTAAATRRLRTLEKTADGFLIAEEDMKLRGAGDMMGVRQAGIPAFRLGDIVKDSSIMSRARQMAAETVATAECDALTLLRTSVAGKWGETLNLGDVL